MVDLGDHCLDDTRLGFVYTGYPRLITSEKFSFESYRHEIPVIRQRNLKIYSIYVELELTVFELTIINPYGSSLLHE